MVKGKTSLIRLSNRFKRHCEDCGQRYQPTGKYSKYCDKCVKRRMEYRCMVQMVKKFDVGDNDEYFIIPKKYKSKSNKKEVKENGRTNKT